MSLPIDRARLAKLKATDLYESILSLACDGVRPHVIAQRLNVPKAEVEKIVTADKFISELKLRSPEGAETWNLLISEERVSNIRVAAQSHAEDALDTLVQLMQSAKQENVKLRAAEDVLQITGAMTKAPQALELVELTPSAEKALSEARLAIALRPPRLLKEEEYVELTDAEV